MRRKLVRLFIVLAIALLLMGAYMLVSAGERVLGALGSVADRVEVGQLTRESKSVDQGAAKSVQAEFEMGVGDLTVRGGARRLMDAEFTCNVPSLMPQVTYEVSGGKGKLTVRQPSNKVRTPDHLRTAWDVRLKNGMPVDLSVTSGVGGGRLDLAGVDLRTLRMECGTGGPQVRLSGVYPSLASIDLQSGTGGIDLGMVGRFPAIRTVNLHSGTGGLDVDLTGEWKQNVAVSIDKGVGGTTLRLPKDVGVVVRVDRSLSKVTGDGMRLRGQDYVNDAYGRSRVTLDISVKQGVGDIRLNLEK